MPAGVIKFTRDSGSFKCGDTVGFSPDVAWGHVQNGDAQWVLEAGEQPPTQPPAKQ